MLMQDVSDILTAIDFAIDKKLADPSKIFVVGGSHGGFLTTHLIGQVIYFIFYIFQFSILFLMVRNYWPLHCKS